MSRRVNPYWITKKWVHDPAARRQALKAYAALQGVERYLLTHGPELGTVAFWEELAYEDAMALVVAAIKRVEAEETAAHAKAYVAGVAGR